MIQPRDERTVRRIVVPEPLCRGDTVGVVAACGPVDRDLLNRGISFFESRGLRVLLGRHTLERNGYLAGSDEQRCADLNWILREPEVRAVLFARGGYGIMRILETIDREALIRQPRLLLGMSDLTALELSLFSREGLVTLSGPMIAGQIGDGLDRLSEQWLDRALTEPLDGRDLFAGLGQTVQVLRHGRAHGHLLGGCLSLVTALLGTTHCPEYVGAILFLEDVSEPLYRIDRMLFQLKLAGVLGKVGGVVLGHFIGAQSEDLRKETERLVLELTTDNRVPVVSRFPYGHVLPNLTIPHGAPVELDTARPSLTVQMAMTEAQASGSNSI
jgi:muramoyltetrapeptide carboxypeptidase